MIKIIYQKPKLYLLDEPTNDLDLESLKIIKELIKKTAVPVIFISHDETLLEESSNMILHFEQIKRKSEMKCTFERMGYKDYVGLRERRLSQQNADAYRTHREYDKKKEILRHQHQLVEADLNYSIKDPSTGRILAKKMKNIKSQEKKLEKMKLEEYAQPEEAINLFYNEEIEIPKGKTILELTDYILKAEGLVLSSHINLTVKGAERVVITGKKGSGKTTLLSAIAEILKKTPGISMGYMPQNYDTMLKDDKNPVEYLQEFLGYHHDTRSKIMSFLGALNFTEEDMAVPSAMLSGGQKAKLFLLKSVLLRNDVLILDEPTRNLSPLSGPVIRKILKNFKGCIISASHDRKYIDEVTTSRYKLDINGLSKE